MAGIRYPQPLGGAVGESCSGSAGRDNGECEGTAVERGRSVVVHAPSGRGAGRAGPQTRGDGCNDEVGTSKASPQNAAAGLSTLSLYLIVLHLSPSYAR